ncbi:copper homeostasis protein CutC [Mucilaginibacter daejeonensis]|uniref:copper homeostasis protein CutC n=1 Tax=Mucilaginibacter daejeonensis TaxID=398049 RepID=UPI001D172B56|nr:copper homeostasis protein CutC [Mucilaginibacter daejeonensis]UEG54078.1 copper homeostasis protein CutC [Mucilaginibacter daejeonensis]
MIRIEICANSVRSALIAQEAGAYRIEFCDNLKEGGTTPSFGQIALARQQLNIKLYPIIRPRGGDFLYTDLEFEVMKKDIEQCLALGCDGVVFGVLDANGRVDKPRCEQLIKAAGKMGVTFHRAFDRCSDPFEALEDIIELGFERILTSGLEADVVSGADLIARLVKQAAGRIQIMPGAGVKPENLAHLIEMTKATEYHTTAKGPLESEMAYREVRTGSKAEEFMTEQTDPDTVSALVQIAEKYSL